MSEAGKFLRLSDRIVRGFAKRCDVQWRFMSYETKLTVHLPCVHAKSSHETLMAPGNEFRGTSVVPD